MMPVPIKIFLSSLFLAIFAGSIVLARKNRTKNAYLNFWKTNWIDRSENEFEFLRQTYFFPLGSGIAALFTVWHMLRS